jgi:alkylation response protein AidB-like acyl-CoA dehydrogenase
VESGWPALTASPQFGGQGLPHALGLAVQDMANSASLSFSLVTLLSQGAVEALKAHGTPAQQLRYMPKLVSGEWTGTMNLTEPQAGSDVGALTTRAVPAGDGHYRLHGTKIFITCGEHELSENIIHLVLARLPDAPAGTSGISLFLVPKYLINHDGSLGARNDVRCLGVEKKLGLHASPTCVMAYGEGEGALGELISAPHRGMAAMFTMMNHARLQVGLQGVSIAERAFQQALAYAGERRQGRAIDAPAGETSSFIVNHADVRRMLFVMKSKIEAARALCYVTAVALDQTHFAADEKSRAAAQARADLLTPIAKAWSSDIGVEAASLGIQIHGGAGYIEETGAAQHLRDARITPIYEGTNGIQAIDLMMRKLPLRNGEVFSAFIEEMKEGLAEVSRSAHAPLAAAVGRAIDNLAMCGAMLQKRLRDSPRSALAGAGDFLNLFGVVAGGYYLLRGILPAIDHLPEGAARRRLALTRFYVESVLPQAVALAGAALAGDETLFMLSTQEMLDFPN